MAELTANSVREELGNPDSDIISDDKIEEIISNEDEDFYKVLYRVSSIIARHFALKADKTLGRSSLEYRDTAERWEKIANEFDEKSSILEAEPIVGGITKSSKENENNDTDRVDPYFERGMFEIGGIDDEL